MNAPLSPEEKARQMGATIETFQPALTPIPGGKASPAARKVITASPFVFRDPTTIPRRQWLYPRTYVRKFVTGTVAPGGVGKTGLGLVECLSMATGRDLLGDGYRGDKLRVWYWNGEDPLEEMERQIHAAMMHFGIKPGDIGDRFFIDSGREMPIKVASSDKGGFKVDAECLADITATIRRNRIDFAAFDPFVSIHAAPENSNEAMDAVIKALAQIANDTDCAVGVMAHTRKQQAGSGGELSADDARGGKALVDAARVVRVLNRMTKDEGEKAGIVGNAYRRYFWVGSDKINLTPPDLDKTWRYLESVYLPNGDDDEIGDNMRVVTPWKWPDPFGDVKVDDLRRFQAALDAEKHRTRASNQSPDWAGHILAELLDLDTAPETKGQSNLSPEQKSARSKCQTILTTWAASGALRTEKATDENKGREYQIYLVGDRA